MNTLTETMDLRERLLAEFELFESRLNGKGALPLHRIRRNAIEEFKRLGFPTIRNEEWKYTNVLPIIKHSFKPVLVSRTHSLTKEDIQPFLLGDDGAILLVFVNGMFSPELSSDSATAGLVIGSIAEAQHTHHELLEHHVGRYAVYQRDGFTALNTALSQDGACIILKAGTALSEAIHLLFVTDAREEAMLVQPRNLILLGENSQATVIESYATIGKYSGLTNGVTEIVLDTHAALDHYMIQNDRNDVYAVRTTQVHQERESVYSSTTVTLGGRLVRNNLTTCLNGEGAESHFYGLYLLQEDQHVDNHTLVDHAKPHCNSNELYKGILDDKSTGVFNGKIMVRQDAQKTNAFQSNRNILLSDAASVNTKPQLEIFADDVKCSHGATTGRLDEEALFYLRSRGLDSTQAQAFLTIAFAEEILATIKNEPVRKQLEQIVSGRLHSI